MMKDSFAIILCGGSGTRLWPLSRSQRPKQLLALNGKKSLLQQTAQRLGQHVSQEQLFVITHQDHRFEVKGQLSETFSTNFTNILAEPLSRNTLPAVAWGVWHIWQKTPEAIIGVFPSDHAINNNAAFLNAWHAAEKAAKKGFFTLLGISPTEAATGYGYIQPKHPLFIEDNGQQILEVKRFVEKPDKPTAENYIQQGYLWNSGMFVFKADVFMEMLAQLQPSIFSLITQLNSDNLHKLYADMLSISIDYGLAEKAKNVAVVPVDMDWSDLGSWDSIHQKQAKNEDNNVIKGDVVAVDSRNNLLWTTQGLLATLGVENLAVIQTEDATLVCDRGRTEDIKNLVPIVHASYPELTALHTTVHRPWGTYTVLEEGRNYKIKRIKVDVGAKLSMQMHEHRSEHWVVISGKAKITNGDAQSTLEQNQSTYIPKLHRHRLENAGEGPLEIIEVQCGDYVGEDDIIRFEDTYGRQTE